MSDRTDPKVIKKGAKQAKLIAEREGQDIQAVMKIPAGRRVLWRILDQSKMLALDVFTGDERTNVNLGRRDMGVWLYTEIMEHAPEQFIKVLQERLKERLNVN